MINNNVAHFKGRILYIGAESFINPLLKIHTIDMANLVIHFSPLVFICQVHCTLMKLLQMYQC